MGLDCITHGFWDNMCPLWLKTPKNFMRLRRPGIFCGFPAYPLLQRHSSQNYSTSCNRSKSCHVDSTSPVSWAHFTDVTKENGHQAWGLPSHVIHSSFRAVVGSELAENSAPQSFLHEPPWRRNTSTGALWRKHQNETRAVWGEFLIMKSTREFGYFWGIHLKRNQYIHYDW